jgi:dTMP kinase
MKEEQLEGELIKKQVEEELERERMRDAERLKRAAKTREEFKKANEDLLKIQAEIALKEKEEERRIEEHAAKQQALDHLKKTKEEERFRQKQSVRQKLIDRQIEDLMKVRDQQEEILNK